MIFLCVSIIDGKLDTFICSPWCVIHSLSVFQADLFFHTVLLPRPLHMHVTSTSLHLHYFTDNRCSSIRLIQSIVKIIHNLKINKDLPRIKLLCFLKRKDKK